MSFVQFLEDCALPGPLSHNVIPSSMEATTCFSTHSQSLHIVILTRPHCICKQMRSSLMKKIDSPICSFCKMGTETIKHLFWDCHITSSFHLDTEQIFLGRQFDKKRLPLWLQFIVRSSNYFFYFAL